MALAINVRHDLNRLEQRLGAYPEQMLQAGVRALNRTITTVRSEGARAMQAEYPGVKIGALKARLKMFRASRRDPVAIVEFSSGRFALYDNFSMRTVGRWGVRFGRLPWRLETVSGEPVTPEMLARAFRNRSRRGGRPLVMSRHSKARLSHEVLVAPALARAFVEREIGAALVRVGNARFQVVLEQEMRFRLRDR